MCGEKAHIGEMTSMALIAAAVAAAPPAAEAQMELRHGEETYIPFPESGIRSWHAENDRLLWVVDRSRRWYRVELMRPCVGLPYGYALGFKTRIPGRFDRTSAILYQGQTCPVRSVVRGEPPPSGKDAKRHSPGA